MARRRKRAPATQTPYPIGVDGRPIRSEAEEQRIEGAFQYRMKRDEAAFLRKLEREVVKNRYFPALMDALDYCRRKNLPLPAWLHDQVWAILDRVYNAKKKNWKRHEAETARREKHWRRYDAVEELLDRRYEDQRHDLGVTRENASEKATIYLGEKPETVRASHLRIKRALRTPDGPPYLAQYRARQGGVKKRRKKR
jgi:hypothetical protein